MIKKDMNIVKKQQQYLTHASMFQDDELMRLIESQRIMQETLNAVMSAVLTSKAVMLSDMFKKTIDIFQVGKALCVQLIQDVTYILGHKIP